MQIGDIGDLGKVELPIIRTIILIPEVSNRGKTTLCKNVFLKTLPVMAIDQITINYLAKHTSSVVEYSRTIVNVPANLDKIYVWLRDHPDPSYWNHLWQIITETATQWLIIEGELFAYAKVRDAFVKSCHEHGVRLWELRRTV